MVMPGSTRTRHKELIVTHIFFFTSKTLHPKAQGSRALRAALGLVGPASFALKGLYNSCVTLSG